MTVTILPGDVFETLQQIAPGSVRCVVTSPPYYGLRSYLKDSDPLKEFEIGSEKTPELYIEKLVNVFRLIHRALSHDGTLWLNLGDSYANPGNKRSGAGELRNLKTEKFHGGKSHIEQRRTTGDFTGYKPKDLMMIPARVAIALQQDGWYLRSEIIWHKPNPMPESVTDRPTRSHEVIYLFSKSKKYYYDAVAIEEPLAESSIARLSQDVENQTGSARANGGAKTNGNMKAVYKNLQEDGQNPNSMHLSRAEGKPDLLYSSRNKRDVWTVPTMPYAGAHFATFPPALIEPCILAGISEKGKCPACGSPWVRLLERSKRQYDESQNGENSGENNKAPYSNNNPHRERLRKNIDVPERGTRTMHTKRIETGSDDYWKTQRESEAWAPSCKCNAGDPIPDVVLDPFGGSGTVGEVATRYRRDSILCELNNDSIPLIHERLGKVQPVLFT